MTTPTIVTLSSIPSRFALLGPTLESLLSQSLPVAEVVLYIPQRYRRFADWNGFLPEVPRGVTIRRCQQDLGPATKVLPATRDFADKDIDLLFCDDDKVYDRHWHARFKRARAAHPNACIVEAGENLPDIGDDARPLDRLPRAKRWVKKPFSYRLKRLLSLFTFKSPMYANAGYVDVFSGHAGVMVKPEWFDDSAWQIPEIIWTVDDPWLSGHLERCGIPIWLLAEVRRMNTTRAGDVDALHDLVELDHDRVRADIAAIQHMRNHFGIWKPQGSVTPPAGYMSETMREIARQAIRKN